MKYNPKHALVNGSEVAVAAVGQDRGAVPAVAALAVAGGGGAVIGSRRGCRDELLRP